MLRKKAIAENPQALIRYRILDRCLSSRTNRYYWDDLADAIEDYFGKRPSRRTILNDIEALECDFGAKIDHVIDGRQVHYCYHDRNFSIFKNEMSEDDIRKLGEAVSILSRFKGLPQFDWMESLLAGLKDKYYVHANGNYVIGFEQNIDYVATTHLTDLFMAIIHKQVLHIRYRTFKGEDKEWTIHPYYLKEYNNRWFLLGLNNDVSGQITNVALDRIVSFESVHIPYINNENIDFEKYFDDVIGVSIPEKPRETFVLRFSPERFPYVISKPLHGSMKIRDEENCIVEISVRPNKELDSRILSFGNDVEVLAPEWFREVIKEKIADLAKKYLISAS
jgi:predicted DNA-binding transcriptional regulator YafY